jgi:type I restriction enzyme S subunit
MVNGNQQLPDGWTLSTLNEASEVILGQSPSSETYNTEGKGLPFYQGKAEFGDLYPTTVKWCSEPQKIAEAGDIFISVRAPVGPTNLCQEKSAIGRGLAALRPKDGMPSKYLLYYLRLIEQEWDSKATGTTFKAITGDVLRNQDVPVAPLPEQVRIVAKIEELFTQLDAGTSALERVQAGLRRYNASVLKAACEGKLLGDGEKVESGELPDGWTWTTTGDLCDCIVPNRDKPKSFTGDIPWITLPDFSENIEIRESKSGLGLSEEEVKKYRARVIPMGSVVMSCIGRFGITAIATRNIVVNQQLHAFLVDEDILDARYLAYAIRTQIPYMEKIATATTIAYLNKENCNSVPIPLPPLEEQRRIVAEVERRLSVAREVEAVVEKALARSTRLRQAVLKSAFEGKLC